METHFARCRVKGVSNMFLWCYQECSHGRLQHVFVCWVNTGWKGSKGVGFVYGWLLRPDLSSTDRNQSAIFCFAQRFGGHVLCRKEVTEYWRCFFLCFLAPSFEPRSGDFVSFLFGGWLVGRRNGQQRFGRTWSLTMRLLWKRGLKQALGRRLRLTACWKSPMAHWQFF